MKDIHLKAIPADVVKQIQTKLNEIKALVKPYAITLTPTERHNMLKMGEKSLTFVEKSHEYAVENPGFVPPFLNMPAFDIDFADAHSLWTIRNDTMQVYEMIDDTTMVAGSESYYASLMFYNSVKVAAAQDVPGSKAIYEELKKRYPGGKRKIENEDE
ncbi:MAG: hypothetical protein LBK97_04270 [Prevotellaceae bacterium]|jgi:hypothetical protein|nr:hypothetical protein [Prevotellaceae bacterium]